MTTSRRSISSERDPLDRDQSSAICQLASYASASRSVFLARDGCRWTSSAPVRRARADDAVVTGQASFCTLGQPCIYVTRLSRREASSPSSARRRGALAGASLGPRRVGTPGPVIGARMDSRPLPVARARRAYALAGSMEERRALAVIESRRLGARLPAARASRSRRRRRRPRDLDPALDREVAIKHTLTGPAHGEGVRDRWAEASSHSLRARGAYKHAWTIGPSSLPSSGSWQLSDGELSCV